MVQDADHNAEMQAAIRELHECYPPFLMARDLGQARMHCLIVGFDDVGELVLTDLLLSSLVDFLGRPRVTIVDPHAAEIAVSLAERCPELGETVDLTFVAPEADAAQALLAERLRAIAAELPFTAAYLCRPGDCQPLDRLARQEGWRLGAIFVRQNEGLPEPASTIAPLIPFGASDRLTGLADDPDAIPRRLHDAYRAAAPESAVANIPWEELSEAQREANRRVPIHIPAKLASAGVALDGWLERRRAGIPAPFPPFPDLDADPALLARLAVLEHDRWMAERRLSGWRYGTPRDNARKLHPDMVPFEALSEQAQSYDVNVIRTLAAAIAVVAD